MKKEIEISAKTKEEAIAKAVEALGAPNETALVITVVREARKGFLGFGAVDATIKAVYQVPEAAPAKAERESDSRRREPSRAHEPRKAHEPREIRTDSTTSEATGGTPMEASEENRTERASRHDRPRRSGSRPARRDATPAPGASSTDDTTPAESVVRRPRAANIDPATATTSEQNAYRFLTKLIQDMDLAGVTVAMHPGDNDDMVITIDGENAGVLIGHHGDTLDALQYLANLAANRKEEGEKREFARITVDVEDYRAKREDALRALARKKGAQVQKYKTSIMLEPMNPYERRIIHSEIQNMPGVTTNSIGAENNRRVVIFLEEEGMPTVHLRNGGGHTATKSAVSGEKSSAGSGRSRRRRRSSASGESAATVDPLAPTTRREPQPSLFDEDDAHDPFDIDLSAALPQEETQEVSEAGTEGTSED